LIWTNKFPLNNIAFLLLLVVARWYALDGATKMFYTPECTKFWKVLYRLFHGKALRVMSGVKSSGRVLNKPSSVEKFDPQMTNINFAVPKVDAVRKFEPLGIIIWTFQGNYHTV
jgi:hypothetical protein